MNLIKRLSEEIKINIETDDILNNLNEFLENRVDEKINFLNDKIDKEYSFFSYFITDIIYEDIIEYLNKFLENNDISICPDCERYGYKPRVAFRRVVRTHYENDKEYILLCDNCTDEYNKYWDEQFQEYYSMVL